MNLVWKSGNDKQGYAVCISVSRDNGEVTFRKSNVEIIFSKYHCHCSMVKCRHGVSYGEFWRNEYWVVNRKKLRILSDVRNI